MDEHKKYTRCNKLFMFDRWSGITSMQNAGGADIASAASIPNGARIGNPQHFIAHRPFNAPTADMDARWYLAPLLIRLRWTPLSRQLWGGVKRES
ncbi:MAG: hypothetical protein WCK65_09570, partial [Rhodospirillaceae bacterium]